MGLISLPDGHQPLVPEAPGPFISALSCVCVPASALFGLSSPKLTGESLCLAAADDLRHSAERHNQVHRP